MKKQERVYAAMDGQPVDRIPLSLWRHFYKQNQTPTGLASATLAFYQQYNLDLIKLTPDDYYAVQDWGATIVLSKDDDIPSRLKKNVITKPEGWRNLTTLNPTQGRYAQELEAIRLVVSQLGDNAAPLLMTLFSPLTLAYQLAGDQLFEHLQSHPTDVHTGLATIAETTSRFADAALEAGANGIFFVSQLSHAGILSEELCQTFVVRYDLIALERVKSQPVPLVLYLPGANPYFETANQYPVHAISWQNHDNIPSVQAALTLTEKTLMGGLNGQFLEQSSPDEVSTKARALVTQARERLILACTEAISAKTPSENLAAITVEDRSLS
jgi:uroporphyrinogen decarboxylase